MSTVNDVTAKAQQAIFDKLGINQAKQNQDLGAKQTLGQEDFLKLMTTQLQNQDPFAPMENGDFIAQMAQFSTVSGIKDVNDSLSGLAGEYEKARIATAASLLGHSVLLPGNIVLIISRCIEHLYHFFIGIYRSCVHITFIIRFWIVRSVFSHWLALYPHERFDVN